MMTKTDKTVIFFINMRLTFNSALGQAFLFFCLLALCACAAKKEETPVVPPVTAPLSRDYIGFGVITASYTHVTEEPGDDSISLGYLRRGSLVRVLRRQVVRTGDNSVTWVLTEGNQQGWLKEEVMEIYDNESQAKTAANLRFEESMPR
jgi:hypothetical protein